MSTEINLFRHSRHTRDLAVGEELFAVGDHGDTMFSVLEGSIDLYDGLRLVESVGPGGIIGELVIIEPAPRSMRAVATSETKVAIVDEKEFNYLVQGHPTFALMVMRAMAERLRRNAGLRRD
jgi:CRP-like cAMP-binding protein